MARTDLETLSYSIEAKIDRLEKSWAKAISTTDRGAKRVEDRVRTLNTKVDVGKFLDKTFDRSRLAVFESGAARIPIFGSALDALGPAGLAAAAGVGAAAAAFAAFKSAASFADEIGDTAAKLQVSTDLLQEFRYAMIEAGGETKDADAAIEGFTEQLGLARVGSEKALKWFQALGFSRQQLQSFASVDDAMKAVADRISRISSAADRAAVAEKLGLKPMLPLLVQGAARMDELRQAAHDLGYVVGADVLNKIGPANDKLQEMDTIIRAQLTVAMAELAPLMVDVAGNISEIAVKIGRLTEKVGGFFNQVQALYNQLPKPVRDFIGGANKVGQFATSPALFGVGKVLGQPTGVDKLRADLEAAKAKRAQWLGEDATLSQRSIDKAHPERARGRKDRIAQLDQQITSMEARLKIATTRATPLLDEAAASRLGVQDVSLKGGGGRGRKGADNTDPRAQADYVIAEVDPKSIVDMAEVFKQTIQPAPDNNVQLDNGAPVFAANIGGHLLTDEQLSAMQDDMAGVFQGAFDTLRNGGDVMAYLADQFINRMLDGLSNEVAGLLKQLLTSVGSGSGPFASIAGLFAGFFAGGGTIPNGQWGVVNDGGPEAVRAKPGGGIQVASNRSLRAISAMPVVQRTGGVVQYVTIQADRSILSEEIFAYVDDVGQKAATVGAYAGAAKGRSDTLATLARRRRKAFG